MEEAIIDRIYEAAFVPETWDEVLGDIATASGSAAGSILVMPGLQTPPRFRSTGLTEGALRQHVVSEEWRKSATAAACFSGVAAPAFTGFTYIRDLLTPNAVARDSVSRSLTSLGLDAQISTLVPLSAEEICTFTFERWKSDGRHSNAAIELLNGLRPHLARSSLVALRLGLDSALNSVTIMEQLGMPAAVLSHGRVLAANPLLERLSSCFVPRSFGRLSLASPKADALLGSALASIALGERPITSSIPVQASERNEAMVVHVLPLRRSACDIFSGGDVLIAASAVTPNSAGIDTGILMGLFDLTPAEAQLAKALGAGRRLADAAALQGIKVTTARIYLAQIFRKTGTSQQSQLVSLLKSAHPVQSASSLA